MLADAEVQRAAVLVARELCVERSGGTKDGSPFMVVLLDPARSAEPPHSSGSTGASALRTLPDAARVATVLAGLERRAAPRSSPRAGRRRASGRTARRAPGSRSARPRSSAPTPRAPRGRGRRRSRVWARTSSSTSKVFSGSKPSTCLMAATSSAPSAEPCDAVGVLLVGAGQADDRAQRDDRRLAGLGLARRCERGVQRVDVLARTRRLRSSRRAGCASRRPRSARATSSVNAISVSPSIEIWLSSQITMRLPSCWWPASEEASEETPSCRSPSPRRST